MLFFYYYYYYTGSTVHTLVFTLLKVSGEHQTTGMVIHYCNELAVNHMNYQYVISEAQDKVNTICRLSSVVVVSTNVDDRFIYIPYMWYCVDCVGGCGQ